jgi:ketosteroid isomerase-like protein
MRNVQLATVLGLVLGAAACGPTPSGDTVPPPPPPPAVDLEAVTAAVDGYVTAMDALISAADIPGFARQLAENVFWFGSAATEALVGRAAVEADLQAVFGPAIQGGATIGAASANRLLGVAPDGRGAWVAEELTVTVTAGEEVTPIPYRVTSVLAEDGGSWTVVAQAWSIGMTNEEAFGAAAQGALPPLAAVAASIGAGAQALVDVLQAGCADPQAWLASWTERPDAFSFGSAPEEKLAGGTAIRDVFGSQITGFQMSMTVVGDVHAALVPSGTLGFVAANFDAGFTIEGNRLTQPYRGLLVYLQEDGGWRLVQSHFSNGLPQ